MACNSPIPRLIYGKTVLTPCRMCMGCRIQRRTEWSNRLRFECAYQAKYNKLGSSFVTVTYSDDGLEELRHEHMIEHLQKLPQDTPFNNNSLFYDDMKKMIKRLRSHIHENLPQLDSKFKYYEVGEYGETDKRAHFHFIFCGLPSNLIAEFLRKSWKYGFIKTSPVTNARIRYCLKYMDKQIFGEECKNKFENNGLLPPRSVMSKGIGIDWFLNNTDFLKTGTVNSNGKKVSVNSYYVKKYGVDNSLFQATAVAREKLSAELKNLSLGEYRYSKKYGHELKMVHSARLNSAVSDDSLNNINYYGKKSDFYSDYINKLTDDILGGN